MKTTVYILMAFAMFFLQDLAAQKYFKIENALVDENTFKEGMALMAQEYNPQIVTYKTFERVMAQDSIIENIAIVVMQEDEDDRVYRVFDFLDRPLPDFKFDDEKGLDITKQHFMGKYTLVGLYKDPGQMRNSHIKSMNDLVETGAYNAVALIAKNGVKGVTKKANFPVLNECIEWYIANISVPESPKFLIMDEGGKLRYIFQDFPDKRSTATPIDSVHIKIFDILK